MPCERKFAPKRVENAALLPPLSTHKPGRRSGVKTTLVGGQRGNDAGKAVKGRKRHIIMDTLGLLLAVVVHWADIDERRGAGFVLARLNKLRVNFPRLKVIFADGGYSAGRPVS